ncbi:MAG TPA: transposase [Methanobacterium sp.]|nr:transposase [Methanobacterium sp.]
MNSIQEKDKINKFIIAFGLAMYLKSPQIKHLINFVLSCLQKDFNGKTTEISELYTNERHRTSIARFFTESTWSGKLILSKMKKQCISKIKEYSSKTGKPVEVIVDDTISRKSKPSSKASNPIKSGGYHYSHTENKVVYGHQIVIVLVKCGNIQLPYDILLYEKGIESKVKIASKAIEEIGHYIDNAVVLADNWYSGKNVIKTSVEAGFTYIGGIKTNRKIYPNGRKKGIQIKGFARDLKAKDLNLVTVRGKRYYTYRYHGKIRGFKDVVIVITCPRGKFRNKKSLKAFICTDVTKTTAEILRCYSRRWSIETFIHQSKSYLGLNGYQIRCKSGIKKFYIAVMLAYCYIAMSNQDCNFNKGLHAACKNAKINMLEHIYYSGVANKPFSEVLSSFKIA